MGTCSMPDRVLGEVVEMRIHGWQVYQLLQGQDLEMVC